MNTSVCRGSSLLERHSYSSLEMETKLDNKYQVIQTTNEKKQFVEQRNVFLCHLKHLRDASFIFLFAFKSQFQVESLPFAFILSSPLTQSRRASRAQPRGGPAAGVITWVRITVIVKLPKSICLFLNRAACLSHAYLCMAVVCDGAW